MITLTREKGNRMWGGGNGSQFAGGSGGGSSLAGYATESWVDGNYLSIDFFTSIIKTYHGSTLVTPNDTESTIDKIKVMTGVEVTGSLSASGTISAYGDIASSSGNLSTKIGEGAYVQIGGIRIVYDSTNNALKVVKIANNTEVAANFYATGSVSALGFGGGGGGGEASALTDLVDVEITNPANGQALIYDSYLGKWVNSSAITSGTVTSVGTGTGLTGGTITTSGTISIDPTYQTYISHGETAYSSLSNYLPLSGGTMTGHIYLGNSDAVVAWGNLQTSPLTGYILPALNSYGIGIFNHYGESTDEGAIIISEDTCVIYNSFDTGWGFQVHDKDYMSEDKILGDSTRAFGVDQSSHAAWSRGGFIKDGSSDSYVLLGGGGHKAVSDFALQQADNNLINHGNEFTFVPSGYNLEVYFNYRTQGGTNGDIQGYIFGNGHGGTIASIDASGNYSGNANTATTASKLSTVSKTAWGQTFWTSEGVPDSISGDLSNVGNINISGEKRINPNGNALYIGNGNNASWVYMADMASQSGHTFWKIYNTGYAYFQRLYLSNDVYFEKDTNGVHLVGAGFYSDSFVSALGYGSSGGGGGASTLYDLLDVNIPATMTQSNDGQVLMYNHSQGKWVNGNVTVGTVTSIATGTGLTGGTITSSGTISISSTYQDYISHGETAYGWGNHANAGYAQASALANYLPLTGGNLTGTITMKGGNLELGTSGTSSNDSGDILWLYGNGNEKARLWVGDTLTTAAGPNWRVYDSSGNLLTQTSIALVTDNVASATRLAGTSAQTAWGQTYWSNGQPSSISGAMSSVTNINSLLYFATNAIGIGTSNPQYALHVIGGGYCSGNISSGGNLSAQGALSVGSTVSAGGSISTSGDISSYGDIASSSGNLRTKIGEGAYVQIGAIRIVYDSTNNALKVVKIANNTEVAANFYATGSVSALGMASGSGGTIDTLTVNHLNIGSSYDNITVNSGLRISSASAVYLSSQSIYLNTNTYVDGSGYAHTNRVYLSQNCYIYTDNSNLKMNINGSTYTLTKTAG